MAHIISLVNHKGGVGKTTSTQNIGKAFSLLGKKVLLVDNDPQANLTTACGIEHPDELENTIYSAMIDGIPIEPVAISEALSLIPAQLSYAKAEQVLQSSPSGYFRLKKILEPIQSSYDYILIDCPPSLGILTGNALTCCDFVIIVAQSSFLSIKGLQTIIDVVEEVKESINEKIKIAGFAITQTNRTVVRREMSEILKEAYPNLIFESVVRQSVSIEEATTQQMDIFSYDPESAGANDYKTLAREILSRMEKN